MRIGFVGAGKTGVSLGKFLSEQGIAVSGYCSRTAESAEAAAAFTGTQRFKTYRELIENSDVILLTVPDNAIRAVYGTLCQFALQDKYIGHCSGALSSAEAFPEICRRGAHGFSIHPLFPFSSRFDCWRELADAFFCLEGDAAAVAFIQQQLQPLHLRLKVLPQDAGAKARYHAAAVFASNFVCGLAFEAVELLASCGFEKQEACRALAPLMHANLAHILAEGPAEALTGPVERGDSKTLQKHLSALSAEPETMRRVYLDLSSVLLQMAEARHPAQDYSAVWETLEQANAWEQTETLESS